MQHKFGSALMEITLQIDRQSLRNRSPRCLRSICKSTTYLEAWEDDKQVFLLSVFAAAGKKRPLRFLTPIRGSAFRNRFVFFISLVNHLIFTSIWLFLIICRRFINQHSNRAIPIGSSFLFESYSNLKPHVSLFP